LWRAEGWQEQEVAALAGVSRPTGCRCGFNPVSRHSFAT
jgi:hypothetical protein